MPAPQTLYCKQYFLMMLYLDNEKRESAFFWQNKHITFTAQLMNKGYEKIRNN